MDIAEELRKLQLENAQLQAQLQSLQESNATSVAQRIFSDDATFSCATSLAGEHQALDRHVVDRYSRQLLVPAFGVHGQQKLLQSSILVVGAGGLGSPVALYLAAAGIGCLGIVDHDRVELNNLHRQVIHSESSIGHSKVRSAAAACRAINRNLNVVEHHVQLTSSNSVGLIKKYDVVVDATDNVPTRYLISDTCVALDKPLVSGAALGMDGQLTVYNYKGGPCYRCLFPVPPPQGACQRCSDSGVLGVVPGIIGSFQALEAIKIASGVGEPLSKRMLILDALSSSIRVVTLRNKNPECICKEGSPITVEEIEELNYETFTGSPFSDKNPKPLSVVPESQRITAREYFHYLKEGKPHLLLDVREAHQYAISALPGSLNIPLAELKDRLPEVAAAAKELCRVIVVCRRGNDSQLGVRCLRENGKTEAVDIMGGLEAWAKEIDPLFPMY